MRSFEFLFLQHNPKHAAGAILHPTGPLAKLASISHRKTSSHGNAGFQGQVKRFGMQRVIWHSGKYAELECRDPRLDT